MDEEQPLFAFAGICMEPGDADAYVEKLVNAYELKATELKGSALCRRPSGQLVIQQVIQDLSDHAHVVFFDKKFALCAKMFEYLIEPAISPVNSLLYDIQLHRFIANLLYCFLIAEGADTEAVFARFESALRGRTESQLSAIPGSAIAAIDPNSIVDSVITFLVCNRDKIADEVVLDVPQRAGGWLLELSTTAFRSILVHFGSDMEPIEVYCDASKPIADQMHAFDAMVGRKDVQRFRFAGREHQITFNLSKPISMVDSAEYSGVQLADIFASATVFSLKNPSHAVGECWRANSERFVSLESMFAQPEYADLRRPDVAVNAMVFQAMIERSVFGQTYLADMPEIIALAEAAVAANPTQFSLPSAHSDE